MPNNLSKSSSERDIHKSGKNSSIGISVFGYENKEKHPIYVPKKCCEEKHVDLLLTGEKGNVLLKNFNSFMYDHDKNVFFYDHNGKNHFWCYFLQSFSTEEILNRHIKDCFKGL